MKKEVGDSLWQGIVLIILCFLTFQLAEVIDLLRQIVVLVGK